MPVPRLDHKVQGPSDSSDTSSSASSNTSYSTRSVFNSVSAGYAAGICGVVVGHPMDSAKVWLQTRGVTTTAASTATSTTTSTASTTISKSVATGLGRTSMASGVATSSSSAAANMSTLAAPLTHPTGWNLTTLRALYSGMGGPLVTVGLVQSVNFALYDSMRRVLHRRDHPDASATDYVDNDSLTNVTLASMAAGCVLAFITSPLLVIKTKQQIKVWDFRKAVLDTMRKPLPSSPVLPNFYIGFGPHFLAETVGRGVYFATYEGLKRILLERKRERGDIATVTLQERMWSAAAAGIACWTVIFPVDALRSRMYAQSLFSEQASSWQLAKLMYQESNSFRPFFRGFGVTVLRAGPVAACVLPVYDTTLEWMSSD